MPGENDTDSPPSNVRVTVAPRPMERLPWRSVLASTISNVGSALIDVRLSRACRKRGVRAMRHPSRSGRSSCFRYPALSASPRWVELDSRKRALHPGAEAALVAVASDPAPSQAQAAGHAARVGQAREPDVTGGRDVVPVRTLVQLRGGGRGEHAAHVVGDRRARTTLRPTATPRRRRTPSHPRSAGTARRRSGPLRDRDAWSRAASRRTGTPTIACARRSPAGSSRPRLPPRSADHPPGRC